MDDITNNNQPAQFTYVTILFGSSSYYPAINGRIKNFKYTANNSTLFTV